MPCGPSLVALTNFDLIQVDLFLNYSVGGGEHLVAVSCGYDTCFAVETCDELYHFTFSINRVGIPFGSVSGSP